MKYSSYKSLFLSILSFIALVVLNSCGGRNVIVTWDNIQQPISSNNFKLKVYIENSGSMDGYMCNGSELKDAVYSYVSVLSSYADTTELNYINSNIIPHRFPINLT